jgi:diguanylate cyclase (GGDEF)-like protein
VPTEKDRDERLARLVDHVVELASGNLAARLEPSAASDRIDAVVVGINMLAEELEWLSHDLEARVAERTRQLKLAQRQLERLALYDPLTGLANRTLLADRITRAVTRADRGAAPPAVLLLDLDGFKSVNDSLGHAIGDLLLVEMADRLRTVVRDEDTVARLGGDEFAVVLCHATDDQALEVADRIMTALTRPVVVGDATCWVGASIGVRLADRAQQPDTLLRDADTAMYAAKAAGGGVQLYRPAMHTAVMSRVRVTEELRTALADAQLALHYQPIVDLRTGRPVGAEALVRWRHPVRGLLQPREFIAIAEDVGLVVDLGRWVLDTAIAQLADWRTRGVVAAAEFSMHINVSPVEFRSPHFAATVLSCLARHDVAAADVLLEVTESHVMGDDPQTLQAMESLRVAGVGLAIDDFGTGYSSIGYLRRLVVDTVKIDRSLVTGLDADPKQQRITAAILGVVSAFGLTCVAEGVETRADAERLAALGCPYGQGSLWGDPEPADAFAGRLSAGVTSCRGRP